MPQLKFQPVIITTAALMKEFLFTSLNFVGVKVTAATDVLAETRSPRDG